MHLTAFLFAWALAAAVVPTLLIAAAAAYTWWVGRVRDTVLRAGPRVAVVRPFRGLEEDALAKNLSVIDQDYAPCEAIFAAADRSDEGAPAALAACAARPGRARFVAAAELPHAASGKARNMIAAWHASDAPFVAFADADLQLAPDDLGRCMALFDAAEVGGVFVPTLFDAAGAPGRLATLVATADAYPLMVAGARLGLLRGLQGGLMVVRRSAVEAAGGIERISDAIADDLRLGRILAEAGFALRVARRPLVHRSGYEGARPWAARFHRWTLCQRTEAPAGFWLALLLNPVAVPLLVVAATRSRAAVALLVASAAARLAVTGLVSLTLLRPAGLRLGRLAAVRAIADLLHAGFGLAAILNPRVAWRGTLYRLGRGGRIVSALPVAAEPAPAPEKGAEESEAAAG